MISCEPSLDEFTLVSWNIRGAGRPDLDDLASVITNAGADVVVLQEAWRSQAKHLAIAAGLAHAFWSFKHKPYGPLLPSRAEGMAILSRLPLGDTDSYVLNPEARAWSHRRRIMQRAHIAALGVTVVNVHLASHGDGPARLEQAGRVVERTPIEYSVVAGDFNAVDEADLFAIFAGIGLRDAWTDASTDARTEGAGFTNPAGAVRQRLDRVLVGSGVAATSVAVPDDGSEWSQRSDHLPVTARLRVDRRSVD